MDKFIAILKKVFKLFGKGAAITAGGASILSVMLALYGPERVRNIFKAILEDSFTSNALLKFFLLLALITVIISAIFCMFNINKAKKTLTREYENNDAHLNKIENILEQEKKLGILAINPRNNGKYNNDAYRRIFRNTNDELIISGHSLNKTISKEKSDELRQEFIKTIIRLLKNKREIKILLVKPNNEDRNKKRIEFTEFVKELYDKLLNEGIKSEIITDNLFIREAEFLPYYIIKNESYLHIAHYTFGEYTDSFDDKMYIFEADAGFGYGKYCYDDFNSFFGKADYIQEYRDMFKGGNNE